MSDPYWPERRVGYEDNVWFGVQKATGLKIVMKLFEKERFADGPIRDEKVLTEVKILKDLSLAYPARIVKYLDFYENGEEQLVLVMERADCNLQDILDQSKSLPELTAREAIFGMIEALSCVHAASLVHRDIKPANLLLMDRKDMASLKLGDFGVTVGNVGYDSLNQSAGTSGYQAPEMLARSFYGKPVDLWSCGVAAFQTLFGTLPFKPVPASGMFATKKIGPKQQLEAIRRGLDFPAGIPVSEEAKDFVRCLLQMDPTKRPSVQQAMEHPWFGIDHQHKLAAVPAVQRDYEPVQGNPDWMIIRQPDGTVYYHNQRTSQTTWDPPRGTSLPQRRSLSDIARQSGTPVDPGADDVETESTKFQSLRDPDKLVKAKSTPNLKSSETETGHLEEPRSESRASKASNDSKRGRRVQFNEVSDVIAAPELFDDEENNGADELDADGVEADKAPSSIPSRRDSAIAPEDVLERRRRDTIAQMYGNPSSPLHSRGPAKALTIDSARAKEIVGKLGNTAGKYKEQLWKFAANQRAKKEASAVSISPTSAIVTPDAGSSQPAMQNPLPAAALQPRTSSFSPHPLVRNTAEHQPRAAQAAESTPPPLPARTRRNVSGALGGAGQPDLASVVALAQTFSAGAAPPAPPARPIPPKARLPVREPSGNPFDDPPATVDAPVTSVVTEDPFEEAVSIAKPVGQSGVRLPGFPSSGEMKAKVRGPPVILRPRQHQKDVDPSKPMPPTLPLSKSSRLGGLDQPEKSLAPPLPANPERFSSSDSVNSVRSLAARFERSSSP
ncbi:hypothetical protein HKX48_000829 [Thoreauomyces humboldtii]|nr:hypothetical protein HKX48_000829 [Thoreauomyces humboldtii]